MQRFLSLSLTAVILSAAAVPAHAAGANQEAGSSAGYVWNTDDEETVTALKLKGDAAEGKKAYAICGDCHLPSGAGRADGSVPALAGQHVTVLIKQMSDIRSGNRINPPMYPFASELANPQALANVAAYIRTLCIVSANGKGSGTDLKRGKELYDKDCLICHGSQGEGDLKKFYPVLAGQHYLYMLRQGNDIRDGRRHNANPRMAKAIKNYADADIAAVADYMSRLKMPGSACPARNAGK